MGVVPVAIQIMPETPIGRCKTSVSVKKLARSADQPRGEGTRLMSQVILQTTMRHKLKRWIGAQPMLAVFGVLATAWFLCSWLVFLAERNEPKANIHSLGESLWWGIVTFLTVGYGDKYPVTLPGRFVAVFLMFSGVFAIAILTSKISSYFLEKVLREGKGMVDTSSLRDHFVVCGWKEEMHEVLCHILDFNPGMKSEDLVLIANIGQKEVDSLREHPLLKKLHVVAGNYFEAAQLKRAAPERARKVLILSDRTPGANGQMPSMTEVDARTIMTAMSLSSIARNTMVAAEILDAKMDQYLKIAQVTEIIYSREYSRLLLGNASGGTGVSNIIFDLLDPKTPTRITTRPIPESMHKQSYGHFKSKFESGDSRVVVIGILENTGNNHSIKELALRQAQKTPDVGRLVQNLRSVKELKCNHPIFNPSSDYLIPEGAMAIVVETQCSLASTEVPGAGSEKAVA